MTFNEWYEANSAKLQDLTRASKANYGILKALELAFNAGKDSK